VNFQIESQLKTKHETDSSANKQHALVKEENNKLKQRVAEKEVQKLELERKKEELEISLKQSKITEAGHADLKRQLEEKLYLITNLKSEVKSLQQESQRAKTAEATWEQELSIQKEEVSLMEKELFRLQELCAKQERELARRSESDPFMGESARLKDFPLTREPESSPDDLSQIQSSISLYSSVMKQRTAELLKSAGSDTMLQSGRDSFSETKKHSEREVTSLQHEKHKVEALPAVSRQ
jgi:hypothetical protein